MPSFTRMQAATTLPSTVVRVYDAKGNLEESLEVTYNSLTSSELDDINNAVQEDDIKVADAVAKIVASFDDMTDIPYAISEIIFPDKNQDENRQKHDELAIAIGIGKDEQLSKQQTIKLLIYCFPFHYVNAIWFRFLEFQRLQAERTGLIESSKNRFGKRNR